MHSFLIDKRSVDVTVRDPVVLTATLPRFLLTGDQGTLTFDLDNVEGPPGDYVINVKTSGPVKMAGNAVTPPAARDLVAAVVESLTGEAVAA